MGPDHVPRLLHCGDHRIRSQCLATEAVDYLRRLDRQAQSSGTADVARAAWLEEVSKTLDESMLASSLC